MLAQAVAALVVDNGFGQRYVALLHAADDLLELGERVLEGEGRDVRGGLAAGGIAHRDLPS